MRLGTYDRAILGYHGTRRSVALRIVQGLEPFTPSRNDDDWLGHGVYFWEHAPRQAYRWAEQRRVRQKWPAGEEVAVLAAFLRLGRCLDLLDPANVDTLVGYADEYRRMQADTGVPLPRNVRHHKRLDCEILQHAYTGIEERHGTRVDSSRAVYVPTGGRGRVWASSWIVREAHVQICVRNPACIVGAWLVGNNELGEGET